jgi:hypothetical protein
MIYLFIYRSSLQLKLLEATLEHERKQAEEALKQRDEVSLSLVPPSLS